MDTNARSAATRMPTRLAPRLWLVFGVLAIGAAVAVLRPAAAQQEQAQTQVATAEQLHDLVGPIALYPDDLVAIVLPASTYPLQIVQAARFLEDRKRDSSLKPNEEWDDSVVALLNYPEALKLLNDDLDWTYDLGAAVLNQRGDVLNAIQSFRDEAYAAGNLRSDERQTVAREEDSIEIKPADPKVIYVPYYEPERVVVYQPTPVYYYYPQPYPVYYYPYPSHYHFGTSFFWGVNTWFSIGWHSHVFHAYDPFYYGHPYYGWNYYNPYYVRNVYVNVNHVHRYPNYVWEPQHRYGGRPVARSSEGRAYTADRTPRHGVLDSGAAATRSREGSAYRGSTGTQAQTGNAQSGSPQPRRGVTSEGYRNRTAAAQPQPQETETARANGANRSAPMGRSTEARPPPGRSTAPSVAGATADTPRTPTYRSGGGMSQALERNRGAAQSNPSLNASPGGRSHPGISPRAYEGSTGAPRESSRAAPPTRQQSYAAPPDRGGGMSAQRSDPAGGRGNSGGHEGGGNGGGSYRGGGGERSSHAAARHVR